MNPIYKFQLSAGNDTRQAFPVYKDDLAIDYGLEQDEQFYRGKLSGKLTFQKDDYLFIRSKVFDTQFDVVISISYDGGQTWAIYWSGQFWKTDCQFNEDDQTAIVTPNINDRYNAVLAGMAKEFNLLDLAPAITPIVVRKRPCLQLCQANVGVVGFAMPGNGLYWESECEPSTATQLFNAHFETISEWFSLKLTWGGGGEEYLYSNTPLLGNDNINYGKYTLVIVPDGEGGYNKTLTRNADGAQWQELGESVYPIGYLSPVEGTGAEDTVNYTTLQSTRIVGRIITDVPTAWTLDNDLVYNNRNYRYCKPAEANQNLIRLSGNISLTPTKYGIKTPGQYYDVPDTIRAWIPIARNSWGDYSIWIDPTELLDLDLDATLSVETTLKDAFSLGSVISVLLGQIDPGITHEATTEYSEFLYGENPISGITQQLFITPKSNIITSNYDNPAQKANITLRQITDMLRDCFRCYWFVDEQNRFRVEHISWFMRGGSYSGTPNVGIDLTEQIVTRNGKPWAYARNQYQFDKPEMAARYQFEWKDDVTQPFEGAPIDIISKYVNPDNIEQISVQQFTTDIDFVLLSPEDVAKDGFMLFGALLIGATYKIPLVNILFDGVDYLLQNGYLAFCYLQQYYAYDMPAKQYEIDGVVYRAQGIKKLKVQTINFPVLTEPDLTNLIKTELGNGTIQKMSVNLSSRNANTTLKYDTE